MMLKLKSRKYITIFLFGILLFGTSIVLAQYFDYESGTFSSTRDDQQPTAITSIEMQILGSIQGPIYGEGISDTMVVYAVVHDINRSFDGGSGQPGTDNEHHIPLTIVKSVAKASPKLDQSL